MGSLKEPDSYLISALSQALDFKKPAPIIVTVQCFRDIPFSMQELSLLQQHVDHWRDLLIENGVIYDGTIANGQFLPLPNLLYNAAVSVAPFTFPAALPLVLDAFYELSNMLSSASWEIHTVEQVVTQLRPDNLEKGLRPARRVFGQLVRGLPGVGEELSPGLEI